MFKFVFCWSFFRFRMALNSATFKLVSKAAPICGWWSQTVRNLNANRAVVTKTHRNVYLRTYPTLTVLPNGATITTKYHEPRRIVKLPVNFEECSLEKQKYIRLMRQPKTNKEKEKEIVTTFDPRKYL